MSTLDDDLPEVPLAAIDLLLGEGTPAEQTALRARLHDDPLAALAMADTVMFVEQCREVRVEPSVRLHGRLAGLVARAERRLPKPTVVRWRETAWLCAAAVLTAVVLRFLDPLHLAATSRVEWVCATASVPPDAPVAAAVPGLAGELAVERMRQRLGEPGSSPLRDAFEDGLHSQRDGLSRWVDPRNAMAWLRLDHELGASAARRWEALHERGALPAADVRVQQLADGLAEQLPDLLVVTPKPHTVTAVAHAVRALVAAGAAAHRESALFAAGDWLAAQAEHGAGTAQVAVLAALLDVVAVRGQGDAVARAAGDRLLLEVLRYDTETWERRLPELVGGQVAAGVLGDLGRLLRRLPAVGVDGARCELVRQLCLGQLRARRAAGQVLPEVMAAIVYGFADLLPETERAELEQQLLRWKPVRLLPDQATVMQVAYCLLPGRRGFARMQTELRLLAVCETPVAFDDRALFCLALAKDCQLSQSAYGS